MKAGVDGGPVGAALERLLLAWPRRRITLAELWRLLDEADPSSRLSAYRRGLLAATLSELAATGVVAMPSARSFDRGEHPPLPRFVTVPARSAPAAETADGAGRTVWHPALSWVPSAALTPTQLTVVTQVDRWLHGRTDDTVVPVRERSLEIFGDEKAIDRLEPTGLFTSGRLSLDLLRCRRTVPRFVWERVGHGDLLLVVENSDTFDSLVNVLREPADSASAEHRVGIVGWGAGAAFEASVRSIANLPVARVRYFGDLDEAGLRIPAAASAVASAAGLPRIGPAVGLYDVLLRLGRPQPGQRRVPAAAAATVCEWLENRHRSPAEELLRSGQRIAQEAVGLRYLRRHVDWSAGLH